MKHVIVFNEELRDQPLAIAAFLREIYPVTSMGTAGEGNGYYADNWQIVWKTPADNPSHMQGRGYRKWHLEFEDNEIHTLLAIKGLL